ncbi:MAG: PEP-CTERM sorting domain-containing protein [Phycisphaerales bacterium]|nr:PEP-CTERM sorting domain-containing protein [Phycisphaerales bacterium]
MKNALCVAALAGAASFAGADIIGAQNFNGIDSTGTFTTDSVGPGGFLTNAGSQHDGSSGLAFATTWHADTRGVGTGPRTFAIDGESGDFIGVNGFGGSNAPTVSPTGVTVAAGVEHNFEFNDTDGTILFEILLSTSGYENVAFSMSYWFNGGYEDLDAFSVVINGNTVLAHDAAGMQANVSPDDGTANWKSLSVSLDSLIGPDELVALQIFVDTNSSSENAFIDDILFTGDLVPAPSALALLGLGGLAAARRRRA